MNAVSQAVAAAWAAQAAVCGVTVTYSQGTNAVSLTAVPGRPAYVTDDSTIARLQAVEQDWIIQRADLVASGIALTPAEGDTIAAAGDDGQKRTYTLMDPPYRPGDAFGVLLRIHSKLTQVEPE